MPCQYLLRGQMPRTPTSRLEQTFLQETVTNLRFKLSPDQMKLQIHLSSSLRREEGQS